MTAFSPPTSALELDYRASNGVEVWLHWTRESNTVSVVVADDVSGDFFTLDVAADRALDAFHHPFAYATSGAGTCARTVCRVLDSSSVAAANDARLSQS